MKENDLILDSFMSNQENMKFYKLYIENPTKENKERLDKLFKKHFYIIRCISYSIKMIHFESRHFDKKQRRRNEIFQLSLDHENNNGKRNIELVADKDSMNYSNDKLEQEISDPVLYSSLLNLPNRQQIILKHLYMDNMKDTEIAMVLGISQQAVSRAKKMPLQSLERECLELYEGS